MKPGLASRPPRAPGRNLGSDSSHPGPRGTTGVRASSIRSPGRNLGSDSSRPGPRGTTGVRASSVQGPGAQLGFVSRPSRKLGFVFCPSRAEKAAWMDKRRGDVSPMDKRRGKVSPMDNRRGKVSPSDGAAREPPAGGRSSAETSRRQTKRRGSIPSKTGDGSKAMTGKRRRPTANPNCASLPHKKAVPQNGTAQKQQVVQPAAQTHQLSAWRYNQLRKPAQTRHNMQPATRTSQAMQPATRTQQTMQAAAQTQQAGIRQGSKPAQAHQLCSG